MQYWGLHMLVDGFTLDIDKIKSSGNIAAFVERLVLDIDMVAYGDLMLEHFATHDPEKAGYSFVQLIETSNLTGHFVDKDGSFYIDVFSCKDYDVSTVIKLITEFFGAEEKDLRVRILTRDAYKH